MYLEAHTCCTRELLGFRTCERGSVMIVSTSHCRTLNCDTLRHGLDDPNSLQVQCTLLPFLLLVQIQLPYIHLLELCLVSPCVRITVPFGLGQGIDHPHRWDPSNTIDISPKVSVKLIHQTRIAVHLDHTAGEFVAITTGQDKERLHDQSHVHNESHEYQLRVFLFFRESLIIFVERCVNDVHVLVEGIESYSSSSNDNHTCNERDNNQSCRVRYDR